MNVGFHQRTVGSLSMPLRLKNFNLWIMMACDAALVAASYFISYWIRFDGIIPPGQMKIFGTTAGCIILVYMAGFYIFNLYRGMWRYTGILESFNLFRAAVTGTVFTMMGILLVHGFTGLSRSVFLLTGILIFLLVGGFRVSIRLFFSRPMGVALLPFRKSFSKSNHAEPRKNLLIIGAGSAGEKLVREIHDNTDLNFHIVGFIDDKPSKWGQELHGIPVLAGIENLRELVEKHRVDEVAIAVPSASSRAMRKIVAACKQTGVAYKTLPGIGDIIQGKVALNTLRDVQYEDLLKRDPIALDDDLICGYLTGKRVMVTGGAGSIGSELCRQIAAFSPEKLIIVERNESGLYDLVLDIQAAFPELEVVSALAAVQNHERMTHIFSHYTPQVVFHAAAYKHVPMMENHPWEAVFNNVVGSHIVLRQCHEFGIQRCVVVSTDKAVRPTNVMGATKRFVELLAQSYARISTTSYMTVRFGNVLGSVGSVLPLFKKQIAAGGPVTVTDPDMTRYFMTIPEACSLILQSGGLGRGGEIFVLKMGTPVRIDDMARDLITLSGYQPGEDIEIRYIGLRPGEKLYEELITHGEGIQKTDHEDIMVLAPGDPPALDQMQAYLEALVSLAQQGDARAIRGTLKQIIPEYNPWIKPAEVAPADNAADAIPEATAGVRTTPTTGAGIDRMARIAAEDRLLLQVLTRTDATDCWAFVSALPINAWEKLIQCALKHEVAPLAYLHLKRTGMLERIPMKIRERLRKIYLYNVQLSMRRQHWVGQVIQRFQQSGIEVMALDGLYLGEAVYRNIAAHPLLNIHLLVPENDLTAKRQTIKPTIQFANQHGLQLTVDDTLHYPRLAVPLQMSRLWHRACSAAIGPRTVKVPCPEDLLLQLCLKLAFYHQFRFSGIRTLMDIRQTLWAFADKLDWTFFLENSRRLEVINAVGLALILTEELLTAPIPQEIKKALSSENKFLFVKQFILNNMCLENVGCPRLPSQVSALLQQQPPVPKWRLLCQVLFAGRCPDRQNRQAQTILTGAKNKLTGVWNRFRAIAVLLAPDDRMIDQIRRQQHNTLIWEWFQGKNDLTPIIRKNDGDCSS
jgi:FlaA1/EpsC-like NDP-sugar epimerase